MIINLLIQLLACYMDLFCIHNDYIIAGINVRGVLRLVLASQYFSYFRCQTAKGLALCVYYIPFSINFSRVSHKCFHSVPPYNLQVIRCAYPNRELNEYRSVFDKMLFRGR